MIDEFLKSIDLLGDEGTKFDFDLFQLCNGLFLQEGRLDCKSNAALRIIVPECFINKGENLVAEAPPILCDDSFVLAYATVKGFLIQECHFNRVIDLSEELFGLLRSLRPPISSTCEPANGERWPARALRHRPAVH